MSELKFAANLFLETQELNRFKKFIDQDGFRLNLLNQSSRFGIISGFALMPGAGVYLKFRDVDNFAFDSQGQLLTNKNIVYACKRANEDSDPGTIIIQQDPNQIYTPSVTDVGYWIKASYYKTPVEKGTCSLTSSGILNGVGTEFTNILRSQLTKYPSKIQFINSVSGNTAEYEINQVVNDTQVILAGDSSMFNNESGLMYKIIGTYTPGYVVPTDDKNIFQYDSILFEYQVETVENTMPTGFITNDTLEFVIGRVVNTAGTITYQDKRYQFYQSIDKKELAFRESGFDLLRGSATKTINNLLPGIEAMQDPNVFTAKDFKRVVFGWGLRSTSFSIDTDNYKITLNSWRGGKNNQALSGTYIFVDGELDGWRVYNQNSENYSTIKTSALVSGNIQITVDKLEDNSFNQSQQIYIVPDAEEIEAKFTPIISGDIRETDEIDRFTCSFSSPIKTGFYIYDIKMYGRGYALEYRLKKNNEYTEWIGIGDGYYLFEANFNEFSNIQVASNSRPYFDSGVPLSATSDFGSLFNGNRYGVQYQSLSDVNIILRPISSENFITIGGTTALSQKRYIDIKRYIDTSVTPSQTQGIPEGICFTIDFRGKVTAGVRAIDIVYSIESNDYTNTTQTKLIKSLTRFDLERSNFMLYIYCVIPFSGNPLAVGSNAFRCIQVYHEGDTISGTETKRDWGYNVTFDNSWDNNAVAGGLQSRATLDRVFLEGSIMKTSFPVSGPVSEQVGVLATGYRPTNTLVFPISMYWGTGNLIGHLELYSDGRMVIVTTAPVPLTGPCSIYILNSFGKV